MEKGEKEQLFHCHRMPVSNKRLLKSSSVINTLGCYIIDDDARIGIYSEKIWIIFNNGWRIILFFLEMFSFIVMNIIGISRTNQNNLF